MPATPNSKPPADAAQSLATLGIALDPEIPYRLETMFPRLEGWGAKGELKKKGKIIRLVEPTLKELLRPGEEVLYIAKGIQYSFAEQYFMGIWAMTINQTVFVLTNVRLLMMRTNGKGQPKETFWMIYYNQIDKFSSSMLGMLTLKLKDKKSLQFSGFPKSDRKTMPQVFEQALAQYETLGFNPESTQSLETLCSYCYRSVPKGDYTCDSCGAEFWKPKDVALRSAIFPSWGDLILKHYTVGVVELIGYLVTWLVVIGLVVAGLAEGNPVMFLLAAFFLFMAHAVDAGLTFKVAGKGLHPRRPPTSDPGEEEPLEFIDA